jgi:hypothetical protein
VYVSDGRLPPKGKGKGKGKGKVQVVAALSVRSVQLPSAAMECRGDVNFFGIDVTPESMEGSAATAPWRTMRRYNDFKDLADRLGPQTYSFRDAPFPKKHFFGCTGETLENRRRGLEVWLQRVLRHPASTNVWIPALRDFLGARGLVSSSSPISAAAAPATSATDLESAETSIGKKNSATPQMQTGEVDDVMEIDVPQGVSAGQLIAVAVPPDQRQLTLALPDNAAAGDTLLVVHDTRTDTLRVLS